MSVLKKGRNFKNINAEQDRMHDVVPPLLSALRRYEDGMGTWSNKTNGMTEDSKCVKSHLKV